LFTGIGGIDLAAEWAGFETVLMVENNPYCQKVLRKHWPDVPLESDIYETYPKGTATLITGGFPCQPFSVAGKQRGKEDDRYLWPEMLRVLSEVRPTWIVAENVIGIKGMALVEVLTDLGSINYETDTYIIPACATGAWHRRDRVFIVAHNNSQRRGTPEELSPERRNLGRARDINNKTNGRGWDYQNEGHSEPSVGRMVSRTTAGVDRLRMIGNSVRPQQIYPILKAIADIESEE
tara:strand:+ start:95 stop:802 length:708 start_codon:yes stop_codon:yes gene_type:complete